MTHPEWAAGVCAGLHCAHQARDSTGRTLGIVHRDVSPSNVLVSYQGAVKLVDFGVAKAATLVSETREGVIKGKYGYMSPEQCLGESLDRRSDIFAVGILLWEMTLGRRLSYPPLRLLTHGGIDTVRQPGFLEWPQLVVASDLISRVIVQTSRQSGLSVVYTELLDFGGAKSMSADPKESLTMRGQVFCTLSYLSPEQAVGNPADARSDLYALGVVAFEMLTGRKPFANQDDALLIQDHIRTPAPHVRELAPTVSRELDAVVARLLEKQPEARFASADALLDALAELPEAGGKLEIPLRRPPLWAIAAAAAALLLVVVWVVVRLAR